VIFPTKQEESQARTRKRTPAAVFRIEGENVGYAEIARRLGLTVSTAQKRMAKLRLASGSVTWDRLGALS
jgi:DNA-directed RNA polymerase specialized sigma24 family protein